MPTKDICGYSYSELSHAYITSPNFPNKIKPKENCECTLESNFESGQILLRRVDMKVNISLNNNNNNKLNYKFIFLIKSCQIIMTTNNAEKLILIY